jgi:hypothetical protein
MLAVLGAAFQAFYSGTDPNDNLLAHLLTLATTPSLL